MQNLPYSSIMGLPLFVQRIADALTDSGILVHAIRRDMTVILSAAGKGGHRADFIVLDPAARTPDEAFRDSGIISHLLRAHIRPRPAVIVRDLWERHPEMMKERMLAHCGIFTPVFARNCEVRRIDRATANSFLDSTHSYGGAACRYCYGLFAVHPAPYDRQKKDTVRTAGPETDGYGQSDMQYQAGQMIAAAEFSNARKWIKGGRGIRSYEWIRYASLPYLRISGGMGKILKHFIQDVCPDDIMSYADLEWSDGQVYRQLGFDEEGTRAPVMFSIDRRIWIRTALNCHSVLNLRKPSDCNPGNRQSYCQLEHTQPDCHPEHTQPALPPGQEQRAMESERNTPTYYRNFGSLKFRLKLTGY